MKTPKLILSLLLCSAAVLSLSAKKDPTLMKVDGKDVTVSEFEYLYNKNNAQQVDQQSLDSYLELFTNYRLKVADALNARIDTTQAFVEEFVKYRDDLARPYLSDKEVAEKLKHDAYDHRLRNITVSHIMLPRDQRAKADSLREVIVSGKATFEEVARANSIDRPSAEKGGLMGAVQAGRFPYAFEEASFNTPVGEISEPVNSGFGWHIIRTETSAPAKGEVKASHILLLTRGKSAEEAATAKERIDSLYQLIKNGADFAALARQYSEDPGSAAKGGDLGWFGEGMMVQPFDSISFAMEKGAVSEPFLTPFGYHIIYKTDARGVKSYEEMEKDIENEISRDYRNFLPVKATLNALAKRTGSMVSQSTLEALGGIIDADTADVAGDEVFAYILNSDLPAYTIKGKDVKMKDVKGLTSPGTMGKAQAKAFLEQAVNAAFENEITEMAMANLEKDNAEYRNLLNEYRDGILLFEISNRKVWDRAAKDEKGLSEYFDAHREKYTWEKPKFKSYIIFASNDSVLEEVKAYTDGITGPVTDRDAFTRDLGERFGKNVRVERVIAAQGENVITDYLGFNCAKPDVQSQRWPVYIAFQGKVLDAPEEVSDVRGLVVADYQQQLETEWIKELRDKYPVKVNGKELKKLRK